MTEIRRHEVIDSTNEEARRLAASGETGPLWVIARSQSKGRGRRGRSWISQTGNLFTSLLMKASGPPENYGQLSFVAALSLSDLVSNYECQAVVTLKWPNDVLLNGRKVAGILLEIVRNGPVTHVVVGFGVNLLHYPADTDFPAASLADVAAKAPDPEAALARLVEAWNKWYEIWRRDGFVSIRSEWLTRAHGIGERLTVRLGSSVVTGMFESIDDDGSLILADADGTPRRITAGDVTTFG